MENIAWFKEISKKSISTAGGKGAQLGEMYNINLPVPPGFVVTANAYRKFLKASELEEPVYTILENLDVEDTDALQKAAQDIQDIILNSEMPKDIRSDIMEAYDNLNVDIDVYRMASKAALDIIKAGRDLPYVAVRSSATAEDMPQASFAGQMASFLNIKGDENLIKAVQKCWASLFTSRAIYYRIKNNFRHRDVAIAVIVQRMVNSEKSGIIFTANPSTNNKNEIVIEAGFGLGEAIVSGSVTPDQYLVDKETLQIKERKINAQEFSIIRDSRLGKSVKRALTEEEGSEQKIDDITVKRLARYAKQIEEHYQAPQDIEFAVESSKIYIVQSRPITTLKKLPAGEETPATEVQQETPIEKIEAEETTEYSGEKELLLQGLSASPGIGSGAVKLIHAIEDLSKIKKGDVLVARMTNPDYVAAMERASAIVTDEGGITCIGKGAKILTNEGFMNIEEVYENLKNKNSLKILSFNPETLKTEWKKAKNPIKRKSQLWRITISQTGNSRQNYLDITPDHKMVTLKNREVIEDELKNLIENSNKVCVADRIPSYNNPHIIDEPNFAYLCGALFTDGSIQVDNRRGRVTLTQKETPDKSLFINTVKDYFFETFQTNMKYIGTKNGIGYIRGKKIFGRASDFVSYRKVPALKLKEIKDNLTDWVLHLNKDSLINFLAGAIDGDGTFNVSHESGRIHIYAGNKTLAEGIILACLRLGISPNISIQRGSCYNIQIVECVGELLKKTKRVRGICKKKLLGTKLLGADQILSDIVEEVNLKGKIKPYVKSKLLLDAKKLNDRILPLVKDKNIRKQLKNIINSDFRMQRATKLQELGIDYVYNFEVEDNHTYIVFTKNYTPLIVWNCHAAIVSREMGIPCVVGTMKATSTLTENELITVDGAEGRVYKGIIDLQHEELKPEQKEIRENIETVTEIKAIVDLPDYAEKAAATGADGVGLLRCEFMILKDKEHPVYLIDHGRKEELVNQLADDIKKIASAFRGKPVWYRTLDAPTDEFRHLEGGEEEPEEDNPMMGWRSIRRGLDQPGLLKAEFEAIKKVHDEGFTNVGVMLPLVTDVEQIKKSKEILKDVGLEPCENIDFGVMVETPAAVQIIKEICEEGIDFISLGTNDLTQFTLAVDRNNAKVQKLYNEMHPAVLRQIKYVIKTCREYNVETSICGQAGSRPEMAEFLVKAGIDSITANADAVQQIRSIVARTERKLLLNVAREDIKF